MIPFLVLMAIPCSGAVSWSYNLSASTVMVEDGEKQEGRIYIKGDKYRIQREGESEYIILRHDRNTMFVVIPNEKVYVQLPLDPKKTPKISERNPGEVNRRLLGSETIEGHPTDRFEITVKEGSRTETFYQWTAKDLNFPIRTAALAGEWSVEFTNIKTEVPDSVFEIPADYEKAKLGPDEGRSGAGGANTGIHRRTSPASATIRSGALRSD